MWCGRCDRRHGVVWFAPSDVWNAVMRGGERGKADEFGFCCPTCFMQLADERGVGNLMWEVRPEVLEVAAKADRLTEALREIKALPARHVSPHAFRIASKALSKSEVTDG